MRVIKRSVVFLFLSLVATAQSFAQAIPGATVISAPVRPATYQDVYPSAYANEILGGLHQVYTRIDRDNIPLERRQQGMLVNVLLDTNILGVDIARTYILRGDTLNHSWKVYVTDTTGIIKDIDWPGASAGQTMRYTGTAWIADSALYNNGETVGLTNGRFRMIPATNISDTSNLLYNDAGDLYWAGSKINNQNTMPDGTVSQTLYHDGTNWVATNSITNDGTTVTLPNSQLVLPSTSIPAPAGDMLHNEGGDLYWGYNRLNNQSGGSGRMPQGARYQTLRNNSTIGVDTLWVPSEALKNNDTTLMFTTGRLQISNSTYSVSDSMSNLLYNLNGKLYWKSTRLDTMGGGGSGTINANRPINRVADGTNFGNPTMNISQFLDQYLFAAINPTATASFALTAEQGYSTVQREYGSSSLTGTLSWSVTKKTYGIASITVDGASVTPTYPNDDDPMESKQESEVPKTIGANNGGQQTFTVSATDNNTAIVSVNSSAVTWSHRYYKGTSTDDFTTMKARLNGGESPFSMTTEFTTTGPCTSLNNGDGSYNCTGNKYLYFLYPRTGGINIISGGLAQISTITSGGLSWSNWVCEAVTITDRFGTPRGYYLLYSNEPKNATFSIDIVN